MATIDSLPQPYEVLGLVYAAQAATAGIVPTSQILDRLADEAAAMGADAVIGIRLSQLTFEVLDPDPHLLVDLQPRLPRQLVGLSHAAAPAVGGDDQVRLAVADQVLDDSLRFRVLRLTEVGPEPKVSGEAQVVGMGHHQVGDDAVL
jgi:hypothetical protein